MYFYCYHCWSDFEENSDNCPKCGKGLSSFSEMKFQDKLICALDHPERLTLQRVIWIIGNLRLEQALPKLSILAEKSQDHVVLFEIVDAVVKFGNSEATNILIKLAMHTSGIVGKYALRALDRSMKNRLV